MARKVFYRALALVAVTAALFIALPQSSASADICNPGEIYCMPDVEIQLQNQDQCEDPSAGNIFGAFSPTTCVSSRQFNDGELPTKQENYIPVISDVVVKMTQMAQTDAQLMLTFVLVDQLSGHSTTTNPVLICADAQNEVKVACAGKQEWFLGQYKLMRNVSLFIVIPLFFIMVIQSLLKGSLYNLLRNSLIMFPLAVIGTLVIIVFMQMFLNITDDFCNYIVDRATTGLQVDSCVNSAGQTVTSTSCGLKNSLAERSLGSSGLFVAFIWFFILMAASLAVYLELIGRQIGVYMMALMLPLVMAGLVWPRTVGIAKKVFQYELALIISKVFVVAALSLGMGAFAHSGSTTCSNGSDTATTAGTNCDNATTQTGSTQATNQSWQAIASGTLIILLAAFSGAKVVTLSPAAMAGTAPVWNKGAISSRGQVISVIGQRIGQLQDWRAKNRKPGNDFKNMKDKDSGSGDSGSGDGKGKGKGDKAPAPPGSGDGKGKSKNPGDITDPPDGKDFGKDEKGRKKDGKPQKEKSDTQKAFEDLGKNLEKFGEKLEGLDSTRGGRMLSVLGKFPSTWSKANDDRLKCQQRWRPDRLLANGDSMQPNYADSAVQDRLATSQAAANQQGGR